MKFAEEIEICRRSRFAGVWILRAWVLKSWIEIFRLTPVHHCIMVRAMRLTINLDDDLYAMARAHAILKKTSLSRAVGDLLRRRLSGEERPDQSNDGSSAGFHIDPETLLPVVRGRGSAITTDEVQQADEDDATRHLPSFGASTAIPQA